MVRADQGGGAPLRAGTAEICWIPFARLLQVELAATF